MAMNNRTITLTAEEITFLVLHISDDVLQDGWFEMERKEFDAWVNLLQKLGQDTTSWEKCIQQLSNENDELDRIDDAEIAALEARVREEEARVLEGKG